MARPRSAVHRDERGNPIRPLTGPKCACGAWKASRGSACWACIAVERVAARICPCGSLKLSKSKRCDTCARRAVKLPDTERTMRYRLRQARNQKTRRAAGDRGQKGRWRRICARDGWVCWICCKPIDHGIAPPNRHAGSVDHVVPISRGGSDTDENLKAAHYGCNARRGAGRFTPRVAA
jgi:5-methylcytosine-specific restriction endonuclease McrA